MTKLKGIDVSEHNGRIDWEKVKRSGIEFAVLRIGFGKNTKKQDDKFFKTNAKGCKKAGIPFGVYIYSYANSVEKAKSEALHTLRLIKGLSLSLPVFYDLEDEGTTGKCSNAKILKIAKEFCSYITASGYKFGVYANKYWFTTKLTDEWYNKYRWVAQYGKKCTYKGDYYMWQYSDTGRVEGIAGDVDMDYLFKPIKITKKKYSGKLPSLSKTGSLKIGDSGENVKLLQKFLNWAENENLKIDGKFGKKTESAVKEFQRKYGLEPDGYFGPKSLKKAKEIEK